MPDKPKPTDGDAQPAPQPPQDAKPAAPDLLPWNSLRPIADPIITEGLSEMQVRGVEPDLKAMHFSADAARAIRGQNTPEKK
jgi:hypothetical protein